MTKSISEIVADLENENRTLKAMAAKMESVVTNTKLIVADLENRNGSLQKQLADLKSNNLAIELFDKKSIAHDGTSITVGISDLEKRNEEAVFDALTAFDKRCPYCSKEQFRVGIRDKIEIDHFVPVARGGQNLPWNLVPICKSCNRKKKDRLPSDYLDGETFKRVNSYLQTVKRKFQEEGVDSFASSATLSRLIEKHTAFIIQNSRNEFIKEFVHLTCLEKAQQFLAYKNDSSGGVDKEYILQQIKGRIGEFEAGVIGSPFLPICDRISGENSVKIDNKTLIQLLKRAGWIDCGLIKSRQHESKKHVFCAPEFAILSKSSLRDKVEPS